MKLLACLSVLLPFSFLSSSPVLPEEDISMTSSGDSFRLLETSFEQGESFTYTAKASFASGQACGILIGGSEGDYLVFNVDRIENSTKLLHFHQESSGMVVDTLASEYFLGTPTTTESEIRQIKALLKNSPDFYFRVDLEAKEEGTYASFYLDNIRRFDLETPIELSTYEGGYLGFSTFASSVTFSEITIGESAYSYYSEPYRNQYHYSQFAHWNNDPNGMVYYNGYYHLYYQTNPTSKFWGDMYWGHARSKDLIHWEELPQVLFPDDGTMGFGSGSGYAWSGSAMVYHKGTSSAVDEKNWFPNGNGDGILIVYTRDGPRQDQIIATSDDGGYSFTKRVFLPQSLYTDECKRDFRDPKIFSLERNSEGKTTRFGMVVSDQGQNRVIFLTSTDLISWSKAGGFNFPRPECVDVLEVTAKDGTHHTVLTFMGREYIVGEFAYADNTVRFIDQNGVDLSTLEMAHGSPMDYAKDRYATQSFFIDDPLNPYYGKPISMSWFSGVPGDAETVESGALAAYRSSWNGGGQSFPVEEGLILEEDGTYALSETPIEFPSSSLTSLYHGEGVNLSSASPNPFENIASNSARITASIQKEAETGVEFDLFAGEDGSLKVGYDPEEGYYVDRRFASGKEEGIAAYDRKWVAGPKGATNIDFTMLLDHGSLEVYCDSGRYPFYVLHISSPVNRGLSFSATGDITLDIDVEDIASSYKNGEETEGMLFLSDLSAELDLTLSTSKRILAYDSTSAMVETTVLEGEDVISLTPITGGVEISALKEGTAKIRFSNANMGKTVNVTVHKQGDYPSNLAFDSSGILAGRWLETEDGLVGERASGDGYILSSSEATDFTFRASVSLSGNACGLLFGGAKDGSDFIIANYDAAGGVSKLFSKRHGVYQESAVGGVHPSNFILEVEKSSREVLVSVNGNPVISASLAEDELLGGYLGLNVFSGRATFSSIVLSSSSNDYEGGDLKVNLGTPAKALSLYNLTQRNRLVHENLYSFEEGVLTVSEEYMSSLNEGTTYRFTLVTTLGSISFRVNVLSISPAVKLEPLTLAEGSPYTALVRGIEITSVTVNGVSTSFTHENGILRIESSAFTLGKNQVVVNETYEAEVTVIEVPGFLRNGLSGLLTTVGSLFGAKSLLLYGGLGLTCLFTLTFGKKHKERNSQK